MKIRHRDRLFLLHHLDHRHHRRHHHCQDHCYSLKIHIFGHRRHRLHHRLRHRSHQYLKQLVFRETKNHLHVHLQYLLRQQHQQCH